MQRHNSDGNPLYCLECDYPCVLGFVVVGCNKKTGQYKILCEKCASERISSEQLEEMGY